MRRISLANLCLVIFLAAADFGWAACADDPCEPDPTAPSYGGTVAARPAQQNARGQLSAAQPRQATGPTTIVIGSESYNYAVPILRLPGRNKLDVNLTLFYNSRVWTLDTANNTVTFNADRDYPSYGFRLGYGYLEKKGPSDYILTEADGTKRQMVYATSSLVRTSDDSWIYFDTVAKVLTYKSGTRITYENFPQSANFLRPIRITDTNGNYISIQYVSDPEKPQLIATITDTLGRLITFNYADGLLTSISQGTTTHATFTWDQSYSLNYNFISPLTVPEDANPQNGQTTKILVGCRYANGTGYNFIYGDWGIVTRIELVSATGAVRSYISYDFPTAANGLTDLPAYQSQTVVTGDRTLVWLFSATKVNGIVTSSTTTEPDGTTSTVTNLNSSGLISSVQVKSGSQVVRTISYTWAGSLPSVITTTLNDSGQQSKLEYTYGSYGNVTEIREYDFGLQLKRRTAKTYLTDANYTSRRILDRVTQELLKDGGGAIKARTDFAYDTTSRAAVTGVTNHDEAGYPASFAYRGNLTRITRYTNAAAGTGAIIRQLTYDALGNLLTAQVDCCNQKSWQYSADNQYAYATAETRGSSPTQLTTTATYYFDSGLVDTATDENGQSTRYTYDLMGRVRTVTAPNATVATTDYDDSSVSPSVTRSSTANTAVETTTFTGSSVRTELKNGTTPFSTVESVQNVPARTLQVSNPYASGETPVSILTQFDPLGRPETVTWPDGSIQVYSYLGNSVTVTDPGGKQRRSVSDALGRLIQVDEPGWGDALPGRGSITIDGSSPASKKVWVDFDEWYVVTNSGWVSVTVNGITKLATYDRTTDTAALMASRLASAFNSDPSSPVTASVSSNVVNLTSKVTGAASNYTLSTGYDWDREYFASPAFTPTASGPALTGGRDASGPDTATLASPMTTTYQYDVLDNVTLVQQAGMGPVNGQQLTPQLRSYSYDSLGRLTSATTPEEGTVDYTYTSNSQVSTRVRSGTTTTNGYDNLNRPVSVTYSGTATAPAVRFSYDQGTNALGRLTRIEIGPVGSPEYVETYGYDLAGRITAVSKTINGATYSVGYHYNDAGQLEQITYPSGRVVEQQYDTVGRLQLIRSGTADYLSINSMDYTSAGLIKTVLYGNGVQGDFDYNVRLQRSSLDYHNGTEHLLKLSYEYTTPGGADNNGLIRKITFYAPDGTTVDDSRTILYTYDAWSRLKEAQTATLSGMGTGDTGTWRLQWGYDRFGNRVMQNLAAGEGSFAYSGSITVSESTNRITTIGFAYDAVGNMIDDDLHTYVYDEENRITKVDYNPQNQTQAALYAYDGGGLRVKKVAGSTTTVYVFSGTKPIAEYENGALTKEYVYAGSQLLATVTPGSPENVVYHHPDHLSIRVQTDANANWTKKYGHFPFGDFWHECTAGAQPECLAGGAGSNKWHFTSYERDPESQLDYAMSRYHASRLGRFMSPDPLPADVSNPQNLNRYTYALNNPINLVDPLGTRCAIIGYFDHYRLGYEEGQLVSVEWLYRVPVWDCTFESRREPPVPKEDDEQNKKLHQCAAELANKFTPNFLGPDSTFGKIFLDNEISAWSNLFFGTGKEGDATGRTDAAASLAVINSTKWNALSLIGEGVAQAKTGWEYVHVGTQISNDLLIPAGETVSFQTQRVSSTRLGRLGRMFASALTGKLAWDTGVYVGALWVCGGGRSPF